MFKTVHSSFTGGISSESEQTMGQWSWSWVKWVNRCEWVTWVTGQCSKTLDLWL